MINTTCRCLDESLRWLYANGRVKEAEHVLRKACRWNNVKYDDIVDGLVVPMIDEDKNENAEKMVDENNGKVEKTYANYDGANDSENANVYSHKTGGIPDADSEDHEPYVKKYTLLTIFKHKTILRTSLIIWYNW